MNENYISMQDYQRAIDEQLGIMFETVRDYYDGFLYYCENTSPDYEVIETTITVPIGSITKIYPAVVPIEFKESSNEKKLEAFKDEYLARISFYDESVESFNIYFRNVRNNLNVWGENMLPKDVREHIIDNHTLRGHFTNITGSRKHGIKVGLDLSEAGFMRMAKSIESKLKAGGGLNTVEEKFIEKATSKNQSYFPRYMSDKQIFQAIREAYADAKKTGKHQFPTERDIANAGMKANGAILYQGRSGVLDINFWFHFHDMKIKTAYPNYDN